MWNYKIWFRETTEGGKHGVLNLVSDERFTLSQIKRRIQKVFKLSADTEFEYNYSVKSAIKKPKRFGEGPRRRKAAQAAKAAYNRRVYA